MVIIVVRLETALVALKVDQKSLLQLI